MGTILATSEATAVAAAPPEATEATSLAEAAERTHHSTIIRDGAEATAVDLEAAEAAEAAPEASTLWEAAEGLYLISVAHWSSKGNKEVTPVMGVPVMEAMEATTAVGPGAEATFMAVVATLELSTQ